MNKQTVIMKYKYRYGDKLRIVLENNKLKILQSILDEESGKFYPDITVRSISITELKDLTYHHENKIKALNSKL